MPVLKNQEDHILKNIKQWNVLINNQNYQVKLAEVIRANRDGRNKHILKMTFILENTEEHWEEFKDYGNPDNLFQFNDCKFLFRRNREQGLYDLYIDGKLIY